MIKYHPTTLLPLLLSYLLLGVIPSQGANMDDKSHKCRFRACWKRSLTTINQTVKVCTDKISFEQAVDTLNEHFPTKAQKGKLKLICGYMRELAGNKKYENNISSLILDNIEPFPSRFDFTEAKNLNGFKNIRRYITDKIIAISFRSLHYKDIFFGGNLQNVIRLNIKGMISLDQIEDDVWDKLKIISIDLSESKDNESIKEYLKKVIKWEKSNKRKKIIKKVELPKSFKDNEISAQLKNQEWYINPYKKALEIIDSIRACLINNDDISSRNEKKELKKISKLIKEGADLNARNSHADNPFLAAIFYRDREIVTLMIENGVNLNQKNRGGDSLLHYAVFINNLEIAIFLIENGIDINAKTKDGYTALQLARQKKNKARKILSQSKRQKKKAEINLKIINLLIENDANVNGTNNNTPSCSDYEDDYSEIITSFARNDTEVSRSIILDNQNRTISLRRSFLWVIYFLLFRGVF